MVVPTITFKKSTRARRLSLRIQAPAHVTVTVPNRISIATAERFVENHRIWIQKHVERLSLRTTVHIPSHTQGEIAAYKQEALVYIQSRLAHFNQTYHLSWNTVTVKSLRSRWGSCSQNKNLSFSYKLALLPRELADYIIVHELCHLKEMNHSPSFWNLVAITQPEYKSYRQQLRYIH